MQIHCAQRAVMPLVIVAMIIVGGIGSNPCNAQETAHKTIKNILYRSDDGQLSDGMREKCRLDVLYPADVPDFATIVWFHGGGLTGGERSIPKALVRKDLAVVAVSYRLHPAAKAPEYIEDAAAAVAWVHQNINQYGGSPDRIVVSGHSAGGYLAAIIGLDKRWLAAHKLDADRLAGLAPISGQMITHFTIRKEAGIEDTRPVIDEYAPLNHVRKDAPPILLVTGDREQEMPGRYEENAYAWRMLTVVGHPRVSLHELRGYDHGQMVQPAFPLLLQFVDQVTKSQSP